MGAVQLLHAVSVVPIAKRTRGSGVADRFIALARGTFALTLALALATPTLAFVAPTFAFAFAFAASASFALAFTPTVALIAFTVPI